MKAIGTKIKDLLILEPKVFGDERGYFFESYTKRVFDDLVGTEYEFVQDNESKSFYGVLRGLHYQLAPYSQAKLVRVLKGRVFGVIKTLKPSGRGELEITDVNNEYIRRGEMRYSVLEGYWSDAGTFESLLRAGIMVKDKRG